MDSGRYALVEPVGTPAVQFEEFSKDVLPPLLVNVVLCPCSGNDAAQIAAVAVMPITREMQVPQ
jgi:hypothetical protein